MTIRHRARLDRAPRAILVAFDPADTAAFRRPVPRRMPVVEKLTKFYTCSGNCSAEAPIGAIAVRTVAAGGADQALLVVMGVQPYDKGVLTWSDEVQGDAGGQGRRLYFAAAWEERRVGTCGWRDDP